MKICVFHGLEQKTLSRSPNSNPNTYRGFPYNAYWDKLQCKQTMDKFACQVKAVYLFLHKELMYACMRCIKYNILVFNWCKHCRHRLARFSVIDVTKFVTKLFLTCSVMLHTEIDFFPAISYSYSWFDNCCPTQ